MMKKRPPVLPHRKPKGFTLIEFIVASSLAIIVIMAAGGTYFMTRKLNTASQQRLDIQQNLRNAAVHITRDARLAGSFGCYNTGNNDKIVTGFLAPNFTAVQGNNDIVINTADNNGFGIHKGTFDGHPALFFIYGQGETSITGMTGLSNNSAVKSNITQVNISSGNQAPDSDHLRQTMKGGGYAVLSSCRYAVAFRLPAGNNSAINTSGIAALNNTPFQAEDSGTMTLSKLHASAYVFNQAKRQLFRVELGPNSQWQSPQLLSTGVNSMDIGFGYTENCPEGFSGAASAPNESFTFSNNTAEKNLPAAVQVRLNYDLDVKPATRGATAPTVTTADYLINATVRGGNTCGNRLPLPS